MIKFKLRDVIYVAGPITLGSHKRNMQRLRTAGRELTIAGYAPIVPNDDAIDWVNTPDAYKETLEADFNLIIRADAVLRLPGESRGADQEVRLAKALGKKVFYSVREAIEWQKTRRTPKI